MMNQIFLVGRLVSEPEIIEAETGKKYSHITLAIPRNYKNAEGVYDTDFIRCNLWDQIAERTSEYCKKGDLISVRGSLQNNNYEKDGEKKYSVDVNVDKVVFLSSKSIEEKEER